jgi:5-methylcytosine-specific restriction protein A
MLVSCSNCNRLHNRGEKCLNKTKKSYTKEITYISKFRNTAAWQKKRGEIKKRDKMLCQLCLQNGKYVFEKLEVHHIIPIATNWNERLNSLNLITLCRACHFMADNNEISKGQLLEIAQNNAATFSGPL